MLAGLLALAVGLPLLAQSPQDELSETEFKVAFLCKIPPYITWPNLAADSPLIIGILGPDPFNRLLHQLVEGKTIEGRKVEVQIFEDPAKLAQARCDILFVPASQHDRWEELRKSINPRGLLTIGEKKGFLDAGGAFNLSVDDRKLEIKLDNVKKAGLEVNSKLLKIAKVYK